MTPDYNQTVVVAAYIFASISALSAAAFSVTFHIKTGGTFTKFGAWHRTPEGRHLMAVSQLLALMLGFTVLAAFVHIPEFEWIALVLYALMAFVLPQRLRLLLKAQKGQHRERSRRP